MGIGVGSSAEGGKMFQLKEKFAGKLSRLLADSPASSPRATPSSPVVRSESEVPPFSKEEVYHSGFPLFSPLLSSLIPTANNSHDGHKSGLEDVEHDSPSSSRLRPSRWRSNHFSWKERPPQQREELGVQNGGYETLECWDEEDDRVFDMNLGCPKKSEATSTLPDLPKASMDLTGESSFISPNLYEFLHSCMPNIVKGCQWVLLYSTMKHGISLRTLLRKSSDLPGPCLLIAGDKQGAVFGGLLECPLNPTTKRKYQGTNATFVFTTKYGEPRLFRATGANRYYYLCLNDLLAFGGGGNFALSLEDDLLHGTSGPCETFGNLCLAHDTEFELKNVELWGFTHSTRYLA